MEFQVDQKMFAKALRELGHDPDQYSGKKLAIDEVERVFELDRSDILDAIEAKLITAHYDYKTDIIWLDALQTAHFYFCVRSHRDLFGSDGQKLMRA